MAPSPDRGEVHLSSSSSKVSRKVLVISALVLVHVVIGGIFLMRGWERPPAKKAPAGQSRERLVEVGGVSRPVSDVQKPKRVRGDAETPRRLLPDIGRTPKIAKDANPMVASVAEALETGQHPERLSPMIAPKPFDLAAYNSNPDSYLNVVEPGRVFQPAQPGPNVSRIRANSRPNVQMEQGETISLRVRVPATAPVTFTSFDLGAFQNGLTSITVAADEEGIAVARFTAAPGTIGRVNAIAASPVTSGQIRYAIMINYRPESLGQVSQTEQ